MENTPLESPETASRMVGTEAKIIVFEKCVRKNFLCYSEEEGVDL